VSRAAALVLAAGASRRMGEPKALLRRHGRSLLEQAVATAGASRCEGVFVVVRPGPDPVARAARELPCRVVPCPAAASGMGHSIACGARAVADDAAGYDALVVLLVDQPLVEAGHLDALLGALDADHPRAGSTREDVVGPPAAFARSELEALAALAGDRGARARLAAADTARVRCPAAALDVDTPEDWRRLQASDQAARSSSR